MTWNCGVIVPFVLWRRDEFTDEVRDLAVHLAQLIRVAGGLDGTD